ncbi:TPA: 30S ribosomal protein S6--L-glutamate ligase [Candidatus Saccharibacteria bacterium]|nr:MAG: Alpha-L-glutamate ligase, RimK family [Candidatus Saccharibacteria bacterium GW2011_GWA2_46_10]OGL35804.1 MAG: alpha-L-glutamate ligase [Candidatus Saccharibacteria bacterium RIFCSPHIGHO2_12_FULL_47_17]HCM52112.1 30S ribosomal protein S6--L-glutamate ligase [Candidatus Saccharibacteria bacterium]
MKIAILSKGPKNYSTKRLQEEATARGHNVQIINYTHCEARIEQNSQVVLHNGELLKDIDAIIPRIAWSYTRYGSAIVRQFEMQGIFTATSSIALVRSRDKLRATQLLARAGIGIPKTIFSRGRLNADEIEKLVEELNGPPIIIKLARGTHGRGVVLAETRKAARSVLQGFYIMEEEGTNILLQEYIEEAAGADIRAFIVGGKVIASMKRQSINLEEEFRSNLHQGGEGTVVKLTVEEHKAALKAAKAMGLTICGVDLIRSKRGPLVLEVNSSPGFGIEQVTDRNVAEKIIEYVELNAKRRQHKDRVGA